MIGIELDFNGRRRITTIAVVAVLLLLMFLLHLCASEHYCWSMALFKLAVFFIEKYEPK